MEILGTKWPSITSTCSRETPPRSTARMASPRHAKSAARIDGATSTAGDVLTREFYHGGLTAFGCFSRDFRRSSQVKELRFSLGKAQLNGCVSGDALPAGRILSHDGALRPRLRDVVQLRNLQSCRCQGSARVLLFHANHVGHHVK